MTLVTGSVAEAATGLGMRDARVAAPSWSDNAARPIGGELWGPEGGPLEVAGSPTVAESVLVWSEHRENLGSRVHAVKLDADGAPLSAVRTFTGAGNLGSGAARPDVAIQPGGTTLIVASVNQQVWAQTVDPNLNPTAPAVRLSGTGSGRIDDSPHVAWDPVAGAFFVTWWSASNEQWTRHVRARRVNPDLTLGAERIVATTTQLSATVSVAANPAGDVVVAWASSDVPENRPSIRVQRIDDTAAPIGSAVRLTRDDPPGTHGEGAEQPDVVWDGARWFVVWATHEWSRFDPIIHFRRLNTSLGSIDAGDRVVHRTYGYNDGWMWPRAAVLPGRDEVLVTWLEDRTRLASYVQGVRGSDGALLDSAPAQVSELTHQDDLVGAVASGVAALPASGRFVSVFREWHEIGREPGPSPGWPGPGLYARAVALGAAPQTTITSAPPDGTRSPTGTATFTATPSAGATFACRLQAWEENPWEACTSPLTITGMEPNWTYELQVRARANGWTDATPAFRQWTTGDFAAPEARFDWTPPRLTTSRRAFFRFTAFEENVTYSCSLDGGARFACNEMELWIEDLGLGEHTFRVWARDSLGNEQPQATAWTWTVFSIEQAEQRSDPPPSSAPAAPAPDVASPGPPPSSSAPSTSATNGALRKKPAKRARCKPRSKAKRCVAKRKATLKARKARRRRR